MSKLDFIKPEDINFEFQEIHKFLAHDVILFLLDISEIKGKTMFQKQVFLASKEVFKDKSVDLGYYPFRFGPWSKVVADTTKILEQDGFISILNKKGEGSIYYITEKGKDFISKKVSDNSTLFEILKINKSSWDEFKSGIIKLVYRKYPKFTIKAESEDHKW